MKELLSCNINAQQKRILDYLQHKPLTTLAVRNELDVMHPASRVQELKAQGFNIVTHYAVVDNHRVASYVLLAGEVANG